MWDGQQLTPKHTGTAQASRRRVVAQHVPGRAGGGWEDEEGEEGNKADSDDEAIGDFGELSLGRYRYGLGNFVYGFEI